MGIVILESFPNMLHRQAAVHTHWSTTVTANVLHHVSFLILSYPEKKPKKNSGGRLVVEKIFCYLITLVLKIHTKKGGERANRPWETD